MSEFYTQTDFMRASGAPPIREGKDKGRSAFQKDYARLIHAPSFRRLQGKTQLFPGHEDDFFRNRLTHSLEVAQIASGVASRVNIWLEENNKVGFIDIDLVEFAALAHDLGHPPFGHNGEAALDELMLPHGGFEGNAQTLHILASVEKKKILDGNGLHKDDFGLDLTYRTLASVLKYDHLIPHRRPVSGVIKGYYREETKLVKKIKAAVAPGWKGGFKTIECAIMDIADDIAYSTYDLEDSLHARFVTPSSLLHSLFKDSELRKSVKSEINKALAKVGHSPIISDSELFEQAIRVIGFASLTPPEDVQFDTIENPETKEILRGIITFAASESFLTDTVSRTAFTAERVGRLIEGIEVNYNDRFPMLSSIRLSREVMIDVELLKHLNYQLVIRSHRLAIPEQRGKGIVEKIFRKLKDSDGDLLQDVWRQNYRSCKNESARSRVICDYVAGMTDRYAVELFDAFYGGGKTIFKPH